MESIWSQTCKIEPRKSLTQDRQAEIAVIGAGMAGILTAYQLKKEGKSPIILEAGRIGSGQTKNTTAKITAQHGLFCTSFLKKKGEKITAAYLEANQKAIEEYEKIIKEEKIACDFERVNSCVYSTDREILKTEAEAAQKLGAPASYREEAEIPVSHAGVVLFENQAQFHPLKFLKEVSKDLEIYENTRVKEVRNHEIFTEKGKVTAEKIIFASHYPFVNIPGMYFAKMYQQRSYILALEHGAAMKDMYIGEQEGGYSFRRYGKYLLFGGQGHRTGENQKGGNYEKLRAKAKELFPNCREAAAWSAQDCITADGIPFIGNYGRKTPDWYVTAGFQKWGMTSAMVSATLLKDLILKKENPYADLFSSLRFRMEEIPQIWKQGIRAADGLVKRAFPMEEVKVCSHLGCAAVWNGDEHTWDCPCHGSRFTREGKCLDGPAKEDLS